MALSFTAAQVANSATGGVTTVTATLAVAVAAGDVVIVAGVGQNSSAAPASITFSDGASDTYTDSGMGTFAGGGVLNNMVGKIGAFLHPTVGQTNFTITIPTSANNNAIEIVAWKVSGFVGTPTIDPNGHNHLSASGTALSSGATGTLAAASSAAVGYIAVNMTGTAIGASPWTSGGTNINDGITSGFTDISEHQITTSTAAITATGTQSPSDEYLGMVMTVYDLAAASTPTWGLDAYLPLKSPNKSSRFGAIASGDSGIALPQINWKNVGSEVQAFQPPHPAPERRAAAVMPCDDGAQFPLVRWKNVGSEIQPPPPPHPPLPIGRVGAIMRPREDGTESPFVNWNNFGWEKESMQPGFRPTISQRYPGIKGKADFAVFPAWPNAGWEFQAVQPPHPRPERSGAVQPKEDGTEARFIPPIVTIVGWGFDAQTYQPPHPRREKAGALMPKEDGTEAAFVPPVTAVVNWGFETQSVQPRMVVKQLGALSGDSQFSSFPFWQNWGFEIQSLQPNHPTPEHREGGIAAWEDGIEAAFVFVPLVKFLGGFDAQPYQPQHIQYKGGAIARSDDGNEFPLVNFYSHGWPVAPHQPGAFRAKTGGIMPREDGTEFPFVNWQNFGSEIQSFQPGHPRPERSGSIMRGDEGIEAVFSFTAPQVINWGFDAQPVQPPHIFFKGGAIARTDDGNELPIINFYPMGWQVQDPQPPAFRARSGGILPREDGTEFRFVNWYPVGSEIQSVQPPHPRPERSGAIARGDDGTEAVYIFTAPQVINWGFDAQPYQPQRIFWKGGAIARSDDGSAPFVNFYPAGFEVQSVQPPHPRPERGGAIQPKDDGTEAVYVFVGIITSPWGFDAQPIQPPHPRPERSGAIARGDEGTQRPLVGFLPLGWPIASHQPAAFRAKVGGILRGVDGTDGPQVTWYNFGWEAQSVQPGHPRPERSGSIAPSEPGIELPFVPPAILAPYALDVSFVYRARPLRDVAQQWNVDPVQPLTRFFPAGFEVQSVQPPHPTPERRAGAVMPLSNIDPVYVFVPPPPLSAWAWQMEPIQLPKPRPNLGAAIQPAAFNIEAQFFGRLVLNPNYIATALPYGIKYNGLPIPGRIIWGLSNNVSQTNDLQPPIDAGIENVTVTFDFGLILNAGVSITGVVSLTCSVFQSTSDTVTDPTPQARILGASQIQTSPNSRQPNQAVLQLVGTMIGGVYYRLQCVVTTSDGQQLSLWNHVLCQTPN
jgi:hypothetical protein